jgi:hypothetical protein
MLPSSVNIDRVAVLTKLQFQIQNKFAFPDGWNK